MATKKSIATRPCPTRPLGCHDATRQSFGNNLVNLETMYGSGLELKLGEPLLLRRATCASGKVSNIHVAQCNISQSLSLNFLRAADLTQYQSSGSRVID